MNIDFDYLINKSPNFPSRDQQAKTSNSEETSLSMNHHRKR